MNKHGFGGLQVGVLLLAGLFLIGCQGPAPLPTLDYAPDNVETIRRVQRLELPDRLKQPRPAPLIRRKIPP
jgi:hypothetical protein